MNAPENKDVLWVKTSAVLDGGAKVDGFIDHLWYSKAEGAVNRWVNGIFGTLDLMGSGRWMGY
jgi:hypothetical protein